MSFVLLQLELFRSLSMFLSALELSFIAILISLVFDRPFPTQRSLQETSFVNGSIIPLKPPFSFLLSQVIVSFIRAFIVLFHTVSLRLLIFPPSVVIEIGDLVCINTCVIAGAYEVTGIWIYKNGLVENWLIVFLKVAFKIPLKISIFLKFVKLNIPLRPLIQPLLFGIRINYIERTLDLPYLAHYLRDLGQFFDSLFNVLIDHGK